MAIVLILLSVALACALVVGLELVRLFSSSNRADIPQLKAKFSGPDAYRPMERLFAAEDFRFLEQRSGKEQGLQGRLHRSRQRVMKLYLRRFRQDFQEAWSVCRVLAPFSADPNFGTALIGNLCTFYRLYSQVQIQLMLHTFVPGDVRVSNLVQALRQVREVAYGTLVSIEDLAVQPSAA
jgi:hypothetical protein